MEQARKGLPGGTQRQLSLAVWLWLSPLNASREVAEFIQIHTCSHRGNHYFVLYYLDLWLGISLNLLRVPGFSHLTPFLWDSFIHTDTELILSMLWSDAWQQATWEEEKKGTLLHFVCFFSSQFEATIYPGHWGVAAGVVSDLGSRSAKLPHSLLHQWEADSWECQVPSFSLFIQFEQPGCYSPPLGDHSCATCIALGLPRLGQWMKSEGMKGRHIAMCTEIRPQVGCSDRDTSSNLET